MREDWNGGDYGLVCRPCCPTALHLHCSTLVHILNCENFVFRGSASRKKKRRKNTVEMAEPSGVCKLCALAPVPIPAPSPMEPYTCSPIRARCKEDQFAPHQEAAGLTGLPRLTAIHSSAGQSSQHYTTGQLPSQWPLLLIGAHRKCGLWRHP